MRRLLSAAVALAAAACVASPAKPDRTEGLTLEYRWTSADDSRASLFILDRDGTFASAGGLAARQGTRQFELLLTAAEIADILALVRATGFLERQPEDGGEGDRSEITVRTGGGRAGFLVRGADPAVDALLARCRELSLRQFRDVIDAQPVAGERRSLR